MLNKAFQAAALFSLAMCGNAFAEELPHYQPLEIRQVCSDQPVLTSPGGETARVLAAGEHVTLEGATFDRNEEGVFAVEYVAVSGERRDAGYLPIPVVKYFCEGARKRGDADEQLQGYVAPPNTCHMVAGRGDTLEAINQIAATLPRFAPTLSAYRLGSGGYALTVGLVGLADHETVLGLGVSDRKLPAESYCSIGAEFTEALVFDGTAFAPPVHETSRDDPARLSAAKEMLAAAVQANDPDGMKQACDLGLGSACTAFAKRIFDDEQGPGRGPATITRYGMLGCMSGDADGCLAAANRVGSMIDAVQKEVISSPVADRLASTEIAKMMCDADLALGCMLLDLALGPEDEASHIKAESKFAAKLLGCRNGAEMPCSEVVDSFQRVLEYTDRSMTPDERFSMAEIRANLCVQGPPQPNVPDCSSAYYGFRDFLDLSAADALDDRRDGRAKSFLESGCAAGDPSACLTVAGLDDFWPQPQRRDAGLTAIAQCEGERSDDGVCDNLSVLDPSLIGPSEVFEAEYAELSERCLDNSNDDLQRCDRAMELVIAIDPQNGMDRAEAMLKAACSIDNINGCDALADLYGERPINARGTPVPARNNPEARLAALRSGCDLGAEIPGNTCHLLAGELNEAGLPEEAISKYSAACDAIRGERSRDDVWSCYEAAKLALRENIRLDDARIWAEFVCHANDYSVSPYGCKLVGNIFANGLGVPADVSKAIDPYLNGCFHHSVESTDGEACLRYGNIAVDFATKDQKSWPSISIPHRIVYGDLVPSPELLLLAASNAFDMGCMDSIEQACKANADLLNRLSAGELPVQTMTCQVRDSAGQVTSEKSCRTFEFFQADETQKGRREQIQLSVYVWPDGDRSVTYENGGQHYLNEVRTEPPYTAGSALCWRNPVTTRSFCRAPG